MINSSVVVRVDVFGIVERWRDFEHVISPKTWQTVVLSLHHLLCYHSCVLSGAVWLSGGAANRLAERNSSTVPSTLPLSPDEK